MAQPQTSLARASTTDHPRSTSDIQAEATMTSIPSGLFKCPPEIRCMIYAYCFTDGLVYPVFRHRDGVRTNPTLLWTNKSVRAEALPVYRQTHIFLVGIPPDRVPVIAEGNHTLAGKAIKRIEIRNPLDRMTIDRDYEHTAPQVLQHLLDHCPQLRFLKFRRCLPWKAEVNIAPWSQLVPEPETARLLMQLCLNLERLEIHLYHRKGRVFQEFRGIAPAFCWTLDWKGFPALSVAAFMHPLTDWQSLWSLQFPKTHMERLKWASGE